MPPAAESGEDCFAAGHLGELTQIVSFDMVDEMLAATGATQARVRALPSRVVVYLLLAASLFAEMGYEQVWARMTASRGPAPMPGSSALAQARRRVGPKPLQALFELLAGDTGGAARWKGLLVCAIDGTTMVVPDSPANRSGYRHVRGNHGGSGYPIVRLLALVTCGTRTLLDVAFGPDSIGENGYARTLFTSLRSGMLVLADRNFDAQDTFATIAGTGADLLIRAGSRRKPALIGRCGDGTWLTVIGGVTLRVIDAQIVVRETTDTEVIVKTGHYRLLTTLTDPVRYPAAEVVELYHRRWEIEITYLELKSTILGGRVLRARTLPGIEQEIYALLITYQALRLAIADATITTDRHPDRGSFTVALNAARDQLIKAHNIIAATTIDLVGVIGRAVITHLLPKRRTRSCPRVTKRAISKHRAKGDIDRTNHRTTITVTIDKPDP